MNDEWDGAREGFPPPATPYLPVQTGGGHVTSCARAYPVARTSTSSAASPWIGQNERRRVRLRWISEKHREQTRRDADGAEEGHFGSATKVISAHRRLKRPPPPPFQGGKVWPRKRQDGDSTRSASELVLVWVL
jgi:hypothetical protein